MLYPGQWKTFEHSLLSTQQYYWNFVSYSLNAANGREPAFPWCVFPFEWERWSTCMMCLVPCMKKTCKGKVQSACCLMNVFPFLSLLVMCFQKTTMWKVGALYFIFQLSFAFYFLVLIEYISNVEGKLNFFLSICWFLDCVSFFI